MRTEDVVKGIKASWKHYYPTSKDGKGIICPLCGHGKGGDGVQVNKNGDGENVLHCFGCQFTGSVIDLKMMEQGLDTTDQESFMMTVKEMGEQIGMYLDDKDTMAANTTTAAKKPFVIPTPIQEPEPDKAKPNTPHLYDNLVEQAQKNLESSEEAKRYLLARLGTMDNVKRFNLGFYHDEYNIPRILIPYNRESSYYIARRIDGNNDKMKYIKPKIEEAGEEPLYNEKVIKGNEPVFVVEGSFDAMSISLCGGCAVAINTAGIPKSLERAVKRYKETYKGCYIVCEDNDEAGQKGLEKIEAVLRENGIRYIVKNISGAYKDANERYIAEPDQLKEAVQSAIEEAKDTVKQIEEAQKQEYMKNSAYNHIQEFIDGITESVNTPAIKTGFNKLDEALEGGLYEGLYILGAVSSLGKTTFLMQIADYIAVSGKDVLIFSLEMARSEIMSKSISRLTLLEVLEKKYSISCAKTSRGITNGTRYSLYNETEREVIKTAINNYSQYANHIFINQGIGDLGVKEIRETVEQHILITGNTPVVIVDYLQILAPYDVRATDKQNTDKAVLELKRISRDFKTPVFAISSLNRVGYNFEVKMESLKESGALEYGSDVVIGFQLKGVRDKDNFDVEEAKKKYPREIEVTILKNRQGKIGEHIFYKYYTMFNYFEEEV